MAASGERRMVFDIRGRRKHVVRVVYAILALLMGASLFLVVGPVNIGSLLGTNTATSSSSGLFEEQATAIEKKLRKKPDDPSLLLSLDPHQGQRRRFPDPSQFDQRPADGHSRGAESV